MRDVLGGSREPQVTVVIVTWNTWHFLYPCLRTLKASSFSEFSLIVVDNGSTDGTSEQLRRLYPEVMLIENQHNLGHSKAVNQGLRACTSELAMVLDADTEIAPDALEILVRFLADHPGAGVVVPRAFNTDGSVQESARNFPSAMSGLFGRQSTLTRWFPNNPFARKYLKRDFVDATQPFQVESVAASCMLLRCSLVERVGEWDEGYFAYFVDTDWCFQLKRAGVQIFCEPRARLVHHEQNQSKRKVGPARIILFHQGAFRFFRKNQSLGWLDPRTWLVGVALGVRAGLLLARNALRSPQSAAPTSAARAGGDERTRPGES